MLVVCSLIVSLALGAFSSAPVPVTTTESKDPVATSESPGSTGSNRLMKNSVCQGRRQKGKGRTAKIAQKTNCSPFCLIPSPLAALRFQQPVRFPGYVTIAAIMRQVAALPASSRER